MRPVHVASLTAALLLGTAVSAPPAGAQIAISINLAPPPLPVYEEPPIPGPDYIFTPGYWAWDGDDGDYYWVPGAWVEAPQPGYLWTPGYWGWDNGNYVWNGGYWGEHIGFYGGIAYGFGYTGDGYQGGYWNGSHFYYNRSVNNFHNSHITNVYNKTVVNNNRGGRASFNGGSGGVNARPTASQLAASHEHHLQATASQQQQDKVARGNPALFASHNHGLPPVAATSHAGVLTGAGVVKPTRGPAKPYVLTASHGAKVPAPASAANHAQTAAHANPAAAAPHAQTRTAPDHAVTKPAPERATPEHATPERSAPKAIPHADTRAPAAERAAPIQKERSLAPERQAPERQAPERPMAAPVEHRAEAAPHAMAAPPRAPQPRPQAARPAPAQHAAPEDDHKR